MPTQEKKKISHKNKGLITAILLDEKGGGKEWGWEDIAHWTPDQGILWVHLDYTSKPAIRWLRKNSGLDKITVNMLVIEGSRPRCIMHSQGLCIVLRGLNLNPGQNPEDMVSVRVWIDHNRIITTRQHQLLSINDIREALSNGCGPKNSEEFLVMLNNRLIDRMTYVFDSLEEEVDHLQEDVVTAKSHLLRPKLADIRRQSILIRRYLAPQREALNQLYVENTLLLTQEGRLHIREATDRIIRHIESLDATRDRATITQEELTSRLSEQMNKHMYLLSIVGVVFLPMTFITGLLGINVGGIPWAHNKLGFTFVCLILFGLLAITLWFFRKKKWM